MDAPGRGEAGLAHQCGAGELTLVREAAEGEVEDYFFGRPRSVGGPAGLEVPTSLRAVPGISSNR